MRPRVIAALVIAWVGLSGFDGATKPPPPPFDCSKPAGDLASAISQCTQTPVDAAKAMIAKFSVSSFFSRAGNDWPLVPESSPATYNVVVCNFSDGSKRGGLDLGANYQDTQYVPPHQCMPFANTTHLTATGGEGPKIPGDSHNWNGAFLAQPVMK